MILEAWHSIREAIAINDHLHIRDIPSEVITLSERLLIYIWTPFIADEVCSIPAETSILHERYLVSDNSLLVTSTLNLRGKLIAVIVSKASYNDHS